MKITLWQLNQAYQPLMRLAAQSLPKEHHKLTYKLAKQLRQAQTEQETLNESLKDLMTKCGLVQGQDADLALIEDFNRQSKKFMQETTCEIWGDPIAWSELRDIVTISPIDLAALDWLIVDDEQQTWLDTGLKVDDITQTEAKGAIA